MAILTKNRGKVSRKFISDFISIISDFFVRKREEIQYIFAQFQVLRDNARKFVCAKISTNKVFHGSFQAKVHSNEGKVV